MTLQNMIEFVKQHHDDMGETEIVVGLNRAQDDFCSKTELLKDTFTQNTIAGRRYYTLDSKIKKIIKVQINDVDIPRLIGAPIIDDDEFDGEEGDGAPDITSKERFWIIDNHRLGILEKGIVSKDDVTSYYQSVSVSGLEMRIHCIAKDTDFDIDLSAESRLPSQYHEALIYKVIGEGYLKGVSANFNPKLSQLFDAKYYQLAKDGRKEAKSNYLGSFGTIVPQDF